mmetsp:Transcript_22187/g.51617  ORF Transcript_22187/g.51617 Transcript_22187/m.51617 type:complete len:155 (+) Transcript_22187:76-540(+)
MLRVLLACSLLSACALGAQLPIKPARPASKVGMGIMSSLFGGKGYGGTAVMGEESIMAPKAHGTSAVPVQLNLQWGCDEKTADRICNFNRHYAEYAGYWESTKFIEEARKEVAANGPITFYDSNTGKPLFKAPMERSFDQFIAESKSHGWSKGF